MGAFATIVVAILFVIFVPFAHGQAIAPQWNWNVSSDFGPRSLPSWDFHEGIDFDPIGGPGTDPNADLGTPIPNLEGGPIFTVVDNATFFEVKIQGRDTGHMWFYGHIFQNNNLSITEYGSTTRRWQLQRSAKLVLPSNTNDERAHRSALARRLTLPLASPAPAGRKEPVRIHEKPPGF